MNLETALTKVKQGSLTAIQSAIGLDNAGVVVTNLIYDQLIDEERKFISFLAELKAQVNAGRVTYRGCGLKYSDLTKVKFGKKEYIISNAQFDALGGISKMRFAAPTRRA